MKNPQIYSPQALLDHEDGLERTAIKLAQTVIDNAIEFIFDKDDELLTAVGYSRRVKERAAELLRNAGWDVGVKNTEGSLFKMHNFLIRVPGGNGPSIQKPEEYADFDFGAKHD